MRILWCYRREHMFHEPHREDWISRESKLLLQGKYSTFSIGNDLRSTNSCLELKLLHCEKFLSLFLKLGSFAKCELRCCELCKLQSCAMCSLSSTRITIYFCSVFQVPCLRAKHQSWASLFSFLLSIFLPLLHASYHLCQIKAPSTQQ